MATLLTTKKPILPKKEETKTQDFNLNHKSKQNTDEVLNNLKPNDISFASNPEIIKEDDKLELAKSELESYVSNLSNYKLKKSIKNNLLDTNDILIIDPSRRPLITDLIQDLSSIKSLPNVSKKLLSEEPKLSVPEYIMEEDKFKKVELVKENDVESAVDKLNEVKDVILDGAGGGY
jgi:hypothetical protein